MVPPLNTSHQLSIQGDPSLLLPGGQDEDVPKSHGKAGAVPDPNTVVGRSTLPIPDQSALGPSQPDDTLTYELVWFGKRQYTHPFPCIAGKMQPKKGRKAIPPAC